MRSLLAAAALFGRQLGDCVGGQFDRRQLDRFVHRWLSVVDGPHAGQAVRAVDARGHLLRCVRPLALVAAVAEPAAASAEQLDLPPLAAGRRADDGQRTSRSAAAAAVVAQLVPEQLLLLPPPHEVLCEHRRADQLRPPLDRHGDDARRESVRHDAAHATDQHQADDGLADADQRMLEQRIQRAVVDTKPSKRAQLQRGTRHRLRVRESSIHER